MDFAMDLAVRSLTPIMDEITLKGIAQSLHSVLTRTMVFELKAAPRPRGIWCGVTGGNTRTPRTNLPILKGLIWRIQ